MGLGTSLMHMWNAFRRPDEPTDEVRNYNYGPTSGIVRDRPRFTIGSDKTILTGLYTRMAIDFSAIDMFHVKLDENERYVQKMKSGLNNCLTLEANIDQSSRQFKQDIARSLFNEGVIAIVPVDTDTDINDTESFDIQTMRVGSVLEFFPEHVRVNLWNIQTQRREIVTVPKRTTAIVENPLYDVMNEPNSILQRLTRKLALLDAIDEQAGSGKLDIIIQLPYVIKSDLRREQARQRRQEMEDQLKDSKYGVAYAESTEKITQLNRPAENNMMKQVEYLTNMLYSQLGITEAVFNGTADEAAMLNYYNRTQEPLLAAVALAMKRAFLTKTARTQGQSIEFYRNPFSLITAAQMAELADKFNRNEIMTGNEVRSVLGLRPSKDPRADQLINKNVPAPEEPAAVAAPKPPVDAGELLPLPDQPNT